MKYMQKRQDAIVVFSRIWKNALETVKKSKNKNKTNVLNQC